MKLKKSSTTRASRRATAMIARVLTLMLVSSFDMDDSPAVILLKLRTVKAMPAVMAIRRNILSTPPSLSASQVTPLRSRFRTLMTLLKADTMKRPIPSVMPSVSFVWASHRPHLLRMTVKASVMLYCTFPNSASISVALSRKAIFRRRWTPFLRAGPRWCPVACSGGPPPPAPAPGAG